jgi:hypothetical protein
VPVLRAGVRTPDWTCESSVSLALSEAIGGAWSTWGGCGDGVARCKLMSGGSCCSAVAPPRRERLEGRLSRGGGDRRRGDTGHWLSLI